MLLNDVLEIFLSHLRNIPLNLTNASLALLCTLTVIDIANMVFRLEETDWLKWLLGKVMKVGLLLFLIKKYTYILGAIKDGFIKIGNLALGKNLSSSELMYYPSKIIDMSWNLTSQMWELVGVNPKSWIFLIIMFLTILGFAFIAFQVIITWIEFYLLCGISIIFIPFGTIKVGENYYTNVLKTIVGCSIKLCILNILLLLSEDILNKLVLINSKVHSSITLMCVVLILAYLIMSIPNLATSLLTGSPTLSANDALRAGAAGLTTAIAGLTMATNTLGKGVSTAGTVARGGGQIASGTLDGIKGGADLGGMAGGLAGSVFGPTGEAIGSSLGKVAGGVAGGMAGGMYSAGKLGVDNLSQKMGYGNLSSKGTGNSKGTGATPGNSSQETGNSKGTGATPGSSSQETGDSRGTGATPGSSNQETGDSRGTGTTPGSSSSQETNKLKSKDIWNNQTSTGEVRLNGEKIGDNK
ncbi:type IV secretion system protein [uncultured Cetobacterium sp.]|uniref:type IV secretion system protein n=2 Tax=Cetobacterium TaxID=180162 RepID=UPI0025D1BDE8|nr:type IV secretion system protein [uncultured Cetobacterium sp.]